MTDSRNPTSPLTAAPAARAAPATAPNEFARRWAALWVLACGLALVVLDGTIVGVALPTMIAALGLDLADAQWVGAIYNVVFAALLLSFGRWGDRIGRRRLFLAGLAAFTLGSVLAALSASAQGLIAARVVQGIGGAAILPATLSSVNVMFRGPERSAAFGIWGAVIAGSAALGPLLGGWLTHSFAWQWIFWVNVPIGLALAIACLRVVPETTGGRRGGADLVGLVLSGLGFGGLVFGLIEGHSLGWLRPAGPFSLAGYRWPEHAPLSAAAAALLAGLLLIVLFILWEAGQARRGRGAILDLGLFRNRGFAIGSLTAMTVAVAEFGALLVLPIFLITIAGLSTMQAGLVLAAMALGAFFAGASARHLAARTGAAGVVVLGLALELLGIAGVAGVVASVLPAAWLTVPLIVYGIGLGLASAQLTATVLADIPPAQSGSASATQSTIRQLGAALGSAVGGGAFAAAALARLPVTLRDAGLSPSDAAAQARAAVRSAGTVLGDPSLPAPVAAAIRHGLAQATAFALAVMALFLVAGLVGAGRLARASAAPPPPAAR